MMNQNGGGMIPPPPPPPPPPDSPSAAGAGAGGQSSSSSSRYDPIAISNQADTTYNQSHDVQSAQLLYQTALLEWQDDIRELDADDQSPSPDYLAIRNALASLWLSYASFNRRAKQLKSCVEVYEQAVADETVGTLGRVWLDFARHYEERNKYASAQKVYLRALTGGGDGNGGGEGGAVTDETDRELLWCEFLRMMQERKKDPNLSMEQLKGAVLEEHVKKSSGAAGGGEGGGGGGAQTSTGATTGGGGGGGGPSSPSSSMAADAAATAAGVIQQATTTGGGDVAVDGGSYPSATKRPRTDHHPNAASGTIAASPTIVSGGGMMMIPPGVASSSTTPPTPPSKKTPPPTAIPTILLTKEQQIISARHVEEQTTLLLHQTPLQPQMPPPGPPPQGQSQSTMPPDIIAGWMVSDGNSSPTRPSPALFAPSPPQLKDASGMDVLGVDLALRLVRLLLNKPDVVPALTRQGGGDGGVEDYATVILQLCKGCWMMTAVKEKEYALELKRWDTKLMEDLSALETNLTARESVAGPALEAVQAVNMAERNEFLATRGKLRSLLLDAYAWEFRQLLCVQQQILTAGQLPGFNGPTIDASTIALQSQICAVMHSAFVLRGKAGESAHRALLAKLEQRLENAMKNPTGSNSGPLSPLRPPGSAATTVEATAAAVAAAFPMPNAAGPPGRMSPVPLPPPPGAFPGVAMPPPGAPMGFPIQFPPPPIGQPPPMGFPPGQIPMFGLPPPGGVGQGGLPPPPPPPPPHMQQIMPGGVAQHQQQQQQHQSRGGKKKPQRVNTRRGGGGRFRQ